MIKSGPSKKRIKRILDPTIRFHERAYRREVARNEPMASTLAVVNALQEIRLRMVGRKLRPFAPTGRLPL